MLEQRIDLVADEYSKSRLPWVIGFSGGKDSSLVVKIFCEALARLKRKKIPVNIVYCDTGVEIPVIAAFVKNTLKEIQLEANNSNLPVRCHSAVRDFLCTAYRTGLRPADEQISVVYG